MSTEHFHGCARHRTREIIKYTSTGARIKLSKIYEYEIRKKGKESPLSEQNCALDMEADYVDSLIDDGELKVGNSYSNNISCSNCNKRLSVHLRVLKSNRK